MEEQTEGPQVFQYRSRGSANSDWQQGEIEAADIGQAEDLLDGIFGIERDDNGNQTNTDMIKVEILNK